MLWGPFAEKALMWLVEPLVVHTQTGGVFAVAVSVNTSLLFCLHPSSSSPIVKTLLVGPLLALQNQMLTINKAKKAYIR